MTTEASGRPGPRVARWAQTLAFAVARVPFTDACRRRYGDIVRFRTLFGPPFVVVFHPELVRQLFRASSAQLGTATHRLEPLVGRQSTADDSVATGFRAAPVAEPRWASSNATT